LISGACLTIAASDDGVTCSNASSNNAAILAALLLESTLEAVEELAALAIGGIKAIALRS